VTGVPESRDERRFYLIVLQEKTWYLIPISKAQLDAFWHVWNTTIKQVGKPAGSPRPAST